MSVVSAPATETYVSKYRRHKFVIEGTRMLRDDHGHPTGVLQHGREIQFNDFTFITSDPDEIAYMNKQVGAEILRVPKGADIGALIPQSDVEVTSGLSTANVKVGPLRCRFCGRANFRNRMALSMHEGACQRKQGTAAEGAPVAPDA